MSLTQEQEKLVIDHLRIAEILANQFYHPYFTKEDLASYGAIALMDASRVYEYKGAKFSTFASRVIKYQLSKLVRRTKAVPVLSLNFPIDDTGIELTELISSDLDVEEIVGYKLELEQALEMLRQALELLDEKELFVIQHKFGLNGQVAKLQSEIAPLLNVSQMTISRIERRALKKMREFFEEEK